MLSSPTTLNRISTWLVVDDSEQYFVHYFVPLLYFNLLLVASIFLSFNSAALGSTSLLQPDTVNSSAF